MSLLFAIKSESESPSSRIPFKELRDSLAILAYPLSDDLNK